MKYRYQEDRHRHKKLKRYLGVLITLIMIMLGVVGYVFLDSLRGEQEEVPVTSQKTESVLEANVNTLKTSFFQFQAGHDWIEVPGVSKSPTFVFRQLNRQLIKREIQISVNIDKPPEKATRVLPVVLQSNRLVPGTVSEHCNKAPGFSSGPDNPTGMVWQGIPIVCNPDSNDYSVIVDVANARSGIHMRRADGSEVTYRIYYIDFTAVPATKDLYDILNSFQPR